MTAGESAPPDLRAADGSPDAGADADWAELRKLTDGLGWMFGRPEPRAAFTAFVRALLEDVPRKNSWGLAKHAAYTTARPFEHLLNGSVWEVDALRSAVRDLVVSELGHADAALVVGDAWAVKQGMSSVGVARQRTGRRGTVENCQTWVMLSLASGAGHAFIDRELYLPAAWTDDPKRCAAAGVPRDRTYATRSALAVRMVAKARAERVGFRWVVAGPEYSTDAALRGYCHDNALSYAFAVDDQALGAMPAGQDRAGPGGTAFPEVWREPWDGGAPGTADPGGRTWAAHRVEVPGSAPAPGYVHWLMLGHRTGPAGRGPAGTGGGDVERYLIHAPAGAPPWAAVGAAGSAAGPLRTDARSPYGLDQYQVRKWVPTYRHITICMFATAFRAVQHASRARAAAAAT